MVVQSEKTAGRSALISVILFLGCLGLQAQQSTDYDGNATKRLATFEGLPLHMQWDFRKNALLISLQSADVVRHFHVQPDGDTAAVSTTFNNNIFYLAPHPLVDAWAGSLADGKPWSQGNYRFLSRLGQRKIFLRQPGFNRSGNLLVFSAQTPYDQAWRLMTYDLKYDNLNQMPEIPAGVAFPVWSPKSAYIAFVLPTENPRLNRAAVVRWDGTGLKILSSDTMSYEFISWPESEQFVLLTAKSGNKWHIIRQLLNDESSQTIFSSSSQIKFAMMLPGRRTIVFLLSDGERWELWSAEPDVQ